MKISFFHIRYQLIIVLCGFVGILKGQIPTDAWRDHLPYTEAIELAFGDNRVYCGTSSAMFYVDLDDNSVNRKTPINGMSDLGIGSIYYSQAHKTLIVGYTNGNIDLLKDDEVKNLSDLKTKNIIANKTINQVSVFGDYAYLACGFGIVVINLPKQEIADTYIIGPNNSYMNIGYVGVLNDEIIALTEFGIYKADINHSFLSYYKNWTLDTTVVNFTHNFKTGTVVHNRLYAADSFFISAYDGHVWDTMLLASKPIFSLSSANNYLNITREWGTQAFDSLYVRKFNLGEINVNHSLVSSNGNLWVAKSNEGLIRFSDPYLRTVYFPKGPTTKDAFAMEVNGDDLVIARGGHSRVSQNAGRKSQFYQFTNESWRNYTESNPLFNDTYDAVSIGATGKNGSYFVGTWGLGMFEVVDNEVVNKYDRYNTHDVLITMPDSNATLYDYAGISGMAVNNYGNLWMIQRNQLEPFVVKTKDGNWYKYSYGSAMVANHTGNMISTQNGDLWSVSRRGGIFVLNSKGTPETKADDEFKSFDFRDGGGAVISNELLCIVEDREGAIWIGCSDGVAVYRYPSKVLSGSDFWAVRPEITDDGYRHALLEGNLVTDIVVDGGNKKWIATGGGGLFLVSPDGNQQIMNLNTTNSPLFSNNILSLAYSEKNGELFIGTDKGILSYMTSSAGGRSAFSDVYAFPNPIKDDYEGLITIRGLMYETQVRITDIAGNVVFSEESEGGDLVWNGYDLSGNKVHSGIYVVLCSNNEGTLTEATKIMIVR